MWWWYINGDLAPYQNRNTAGIAVDMAYLLKDWEQCHPGEVINEIKFVWQEREVAP
jgi:hypothetical protein